LLWFGVIESGITTNYLLLPVAFMLVTLAIDAAALLPRMRVPAIAIVALVVAFDQWGTAPVDRLAAARPTIQVEGIEEIRAGLHASDRVACTDELGCLLLVGRIDRWLALDDFVRERFVVEQAGGSAAGVYTGVPAAFRPGDLFGPFDSADVQRSLAQGKPLEAGTLPDRVVVVDIFKDYPVGNSRSWLPRAIEQEGLQVSPLLETPQMRVLSISPREQVARLR
jgi:hypothetical protein